MLYLASISSFLAKPFILEQSWWFIVMAIVIAVPCALLGCFLQLRRMALVGDAISHSVLPGIVIAFLVVRDLSSPWLLIGAGLTGMLVTLLIELIHTKSRVKQDAAIGIAFTTLFALGMLIVAIYAKGAHIDECVISGELTNLANYDTLAFAGLEIPKPIINSSIVATITLLLVGICYRLLLLSSFDAGLTASFGINPKTVHYLLMSILSFVVVTSFQAVGAILVIALLIIPAASAYLCTHRLKWMLGLACLHAILSSFFAAYIYAYIPCSFAAAMVVAGLCLFALAWLIGPVDGLVWRWKRRLMTTTSYDMADS